MTIQQTISIGLTTGSCSDTFRILDVYNYKNQELIVVSKLSNPSRFGLGLASYGHPVATATVEVESLLPLRHYVIGLHEGWQEELMPQWPHTRINSQDEIPQEEKENCLFSNEYSDAKEKEEHRLRDEKEDKFYADRRAAREAKEAREAQKSGITKCGMFAVATIVSGIGIAVTAYSLSSNKM